MKTLPVGIPIDDAVTRPIWLLTLGFSSGTVRYSSREQVTISSVTYRESGFTVTQLSTDDRGVMTATVSIPSLDGAVRALIFNDTWRGESATLGMVYGESGWTSADIVSVFDGIMDSAPEVGHAVQISLISTGGGTEFSPRHFARPGTCNHIPPAGSSITWGGQTSVLPPPISGGGSGIDRSKTPRGWGGRPTFGT